MLRVVCALENQNVQQELPSKRALPEKEQGRNIGLKDREACDTWGDGSEVLVGATQRDTAADRLSNCAVWKAS